MSYPLKSDCRSAFSRLKSSEYFRYLELKLATEPNWFSFLYSHLLQKLRFDVIQIILKTCAKIAFKAESKSQRTSETNVKIAALKYNKHSKTATNLVCKKTQLCLNTK